MKKIFRFIIVLSLAVIFNGCLNYEQITTIRKDHSGKIYIHYWADMKDSINYNFLNGFGIFDSLTISSQLDSNITSQKRINVFIDHSDSTIHSQIEFTFANLLELNSLKLFEDSQFDIKSIDENAEYFSQQIRSYAQGIEPDSNFYNYSYTYYLPGNIFKHNADDISRNKLIWKFDNTSFPDTNIMYAEYIPFKLKETPVMIYWLAGLMLLIVLVYIFKRR